MSETYLGIFVMFLLKPYVTIIIWYVIGILLITRWIRKGLEKGDPKAIGIRDAPTLPLICGCAIAATTAPAFALWRLIKPRVD